MDKKEDLNTLKDKELLLKAKKAFIMNNTVKR